jgi:hypothetical protein
MKRILLPTDFTCHSKHTLEYVLNFLQDTQISCHITLVNTYMVQQTDPRQVIQLNDQLKQTSKKGLEQALDYAQSQIKNPLITVDIASHMGSLNNVVLQMIRDKEFDLVAMGKNGGKHVETISVLLKQLECPLLITYLKE